MKIKRAKKSVRTGTLVPGIRGVHVGDLIPDTHPVVKKLPDVFEDVEEFVARRFPDYFAATEQSKRRRSKPKAKTAQPEQRKASEPTQKEQATDGTE